MSQGLKVHVNPEIVIHSAAYTNVRSAEKEIEKLIDVNVLGTINLIKLATLI